MLLSDRRIQDQCCQKILNMTGTMRPKVMSHNREIFFSSSEDQRRPSSAIGHSFSTSSSPGLIHNRWRRERLNQLDPILELSRNSALKDFIEKTCITTRTPSISPLKAHTLTMVLAAFLFIEDLRNPEHKRTSLLFKIRFEP